MKRDELGQYLAETLDLYLHQDDVRSRPWYRETVGDLLTHVDAYITADRERIAQAIEEASELSYNARRPDIVHGMRVAARIVRAES